MEAAEALLHGHLVGALVVVAAVVECAAAGLQFHGGAVVFAGDFVQHRETGFDEVAAGPATELLTAERLSLLYGQRLVAIAHARGSVFVPA